MHKVIVLTGVCTLFLTGLWAQPTESGAYREIPDLPYTGEDEEVDSLRMLNLLVPEGLDTIPLLVWIGGGAWSYVDRAMEMDLARRFVREGIAVASVGHRLSAAVWQDPALDTGVRHPTHVKDVAQAIRWLYDHASAYGYSREQIFLGGYSSGAHLAALLCADPRYLQAVGLSTDLIRGVIPVAGAYDIVDYHRVFLNSETSRAMADTHVKAVFGDSEADFRQASPVTYVEQFSTPMLLISDSDLYNYTRLFEDKLRATEFRDWSVLHVREFGHSALWKDLSYSDRSACRDLMTGFIKARTASRDPS